MNIFVLDSCPKKSVKYYCDKHVVKMILEYAQLLSTTLRLVDGSEKLVWLESKKSTKKRNIFLLEGEKLLSTFSGPVLLEKNRLAYMLTHKNHPCAVWARQSLQNWQWLKTLATYLNTEYKTRFGHANNHKAFDLIQSLPTPINLPSTGLTPLPTCMDDKYKLGNVVDSYRNYYNLGKFKICSWRNKQPYWYKPNQPYLTA